ncbi:hypothetical protein AL052_01350 [Pseudomonas amygdali pv. eriobotryae]|nr:hypothetical protein AL052_01350 [Pseudomonas amygdali pv. eriobotryae]
MQVLTAGEPICDHVIVIAAHRLKQYEALSLLHRFDLRGGDCRPIGNQSCTIQKHAGSVPSTHSRSLGEIGIDKHVPLDLLSLQNF